MPDVTKLIEQGHRDVEKLFRTFKETGYSAPASVICAELDVHAAVEEEVFYTFVRGDLPYG